MLPPGSLRTSLQKIIVPVFLADPGGQGLGGAPARQFTGLNRGIFLAGARVTLKLELKVTRDPRGVKKMKGTRSGPHRVPCRTVKNSPG